MGNIEKHDYKAAFDFLLAKAKDANAEVPTIDGKTPHDLQEFLKIMPENANLSEKHKAEAKPLFGKPQEGYYRTAWNLFHRIQSTAAAKRRQAVYATIARDRREAAATVS